MRRLSLLLLSLVFVVGCGQSYKEALQVYADEVLVLEWMQGTKDKAILKRDSLTQEAKDICGSDIDRLTQHLDKIDVIYTPFLAKLDRAIENQTEHVRQARLTRDKLK